MYSDADDFELVQASMEGDESAFTEIVHRYRDQVARWIKGMLNDSNYAEDIGQEVFVKLYHALPEFRGDAKLSTYIQKIAVNLTINEINRRKRFFSLFSQNGDSEVREYDIPDIEDEERNDVKEMVDMALNTLEPKFRAVVVMRLLQGYSTKETAEILDIPLGTVLSRLSRAREQLKAVLEKL